MFLMDAFIRSLTPEVRPVNHIMNTDLAILGSPHKYKFLWNTPFEDYSKQLHSEWLLGGDHILTPAGKLKIPV
jgi:hypothetical protein